MSWVDYLPHVEMRDLLRSLVEVVDPHTKAGLIVAYYEDKYKDREPQVVEEILDWGKDPREMV